jgi:hypothetical protein
LCDKRYLKKYEYAAFNEVNFVSVKQEYGGGGKLVFSFHFDDTQ